MARMWWVVVLLGAGSIPAVGQDQTVPDAGQVPADFEQAVKWRAPRYLSATQAWQDADGDGLSRYHDTDDDSDGLPDEPLHAKPL